MRAIQTWQKVTMASGFLSILIAVVFMADLIDIRAAGAILGVLMYMGLELLKLRTHINTLREPLYGPRLQGTTEG